MTAVHEQVVATDLGLVLESARENRGKEDFAQDEQVPPAQVQSARHGNVRTRRLVGKRWGSSLDSDSDSDVQGADRGSVTVSPKDATTASQQPRVPLRPMDMHLNKLSQTAHTTSKEKKKELEREEEEEARAAAPKSVLTDTKLSRKLQVPSCGAATIVIGDSASDNNDSYSGQRNRSVGIGSRDESEHARQPVEAEAETETETVHAATSETLTRPTLLGMGATQNAARLHTLQLAKLTLPCCAVGSRQGLLDHAGWLRTKSSVQPRRLNVSQIKAQNKPKLKSVWPCACTSH